ncbi:hypothetical protein [Vibrio fluminensis]|uniref:hypothetical protein n=1 Tax=Vibrio fluminensis TaxID=2783614 RepID=UPI00188909C3|nr:hypothetical protein [Vibrio fluminensis]
MGKRESKLGKTNDVQEIQKFISWEPIPDTPRRVICNSLSDGDEGLCIELSEYFLPNDAQSSVPRKLRIKFDAFIAYRNIDESYRLRLLEQNQNREVSLFIVESSYWLDWLQKESHGYYEDRKVVHYLIMSMNDCIDVLSEFEPDIEIV